jgi:hypothetical protein
MDQLDGVGVVRAESFGRFAHHVEDALTSRPLRCSRNP